MNNMKKKNLLSICCYVACCLVSFNVSLASADLAEIDAGIVPKSINGRCFNDMNQNEQIDDGEPGIPDVQLTLKRLYGFSFRTVARIRTDSSGNYNFTTNKWGLYQIEETNPPDSTSTTPDTVVFFIGLFNRKPSINFGNLLTDAAKPEVSITADPAAIKKGDSSTLHWSAENADTVSIDQGIGAVPAAGSVEVFPLGTTTYTITAVGKGGTAQSSIMVIVQNSVTTTTTIPNPPPPTSTTSTTAKLTSTTTTVSATTTVRPTTTTTGVSTTTTTQEPQTIITLASFSSIPGNKMVTLKWVTESEAENAGFNVYRVESANESYIKLNSSLVPAQGTSISGGTYTFIDNDVVNRTTYYYKLEAIDIHGVATVHGPVSATPLFLHGIR